MVQVPGILFNRRVLVVHNGMDAMTAPGRATASLVQDLRDRDIEVIDAVSVDEAAAQIATHSLLQAVMVDWELAGRAEHEAASRR
jgi:arginine decarboxylase